MATIPALVAPASVPLYFLVGRASLPAINFAGRDACATEDARATGRYRAVTEFVTVFMPWSSVGLRAGIVGGRAS